MKKNGYELSIAESNRQRRDWFLGYLLLTIVVADKMLDKICL